MNDLIKDLVNTIKSTPQPHTVDSLHHFVLLVMAHYRQCWIVDQDLLVGCMNLLESSLQSLFLSSSKLDDKNMTTLTSVCNSYNQLLTFYSIIGHDKNIDSVDVLLEKSKCEWFQYETKEMTVPSIDMELYAVFILLEKRCVVENIFYFNQEENKAFFTKGDHTVFIQPPSKDYLTIYRIMTLQDNIFHYLMKNFVKYLRIDFGFQRCDDGAYEVHIYDKEKKEYLSSIDDIQLNDGQMWQNEYHLPSLLFRNAFIRYLHTINWPINDKSSNGAYKIQIRFK
jgi:hypothetical protein